MEKLATRPNDKPSHKSEKYSRMHLGPEAMQDIKYSSEEMGLASMEEVDRLRALLEQQTELTPEQEALLDAEIARQEARVLDKEAWARQSEKERQDNIDRLKANIEAIYHEESQIDNSEQNQQTNSNTHTQNQTDSQTPAAGGGGQPEAKQETKLEYGGKTGETFDQDKKEAQRLEAIKAEEEARDNLIKSIEKSEENTSDKSQDIVELAKSFDPEAYRGNELPSDIEALMRAAIIDNINNGSLNQVNFVEILEEIDPKLKDEFEVFIAAGNQARLNFRSEFQDGMKNSAHTLSNAAGDFFVGPDSTPNSFDWLDPKDYVRFIYNLPGSMIAAIAYTAPGLIIDSVSGTETFRGEDGNYQEKSLNPVQRVAKVLEGGFMISSLFMGPSGNLVKSGSKELMMIKAKQNIWSKLASLFKDGFIPEAAEGVIEAYLDDLGDDGVLNKPIEQYAQEIVLEGAGGLIMETYNQQANLSRSLDVYHVNPANSKTAAKTNIDNSIITSPVEATDFVIADEGGNVITEFHNGVETDVNGQVVEQSGDIEVGPAGFVEVTETAEVAKAVDIAETVTTTETIDSVTTTEATMGTTEAVVEADGALDALSQSKESHSTDLEFNQRKPRESVSEIIRLLNNQEFEQIGDIVVRPRTEILCDRGHIENQRIDIINKKDRGVTEFRFKLRTSTESMLAMTTKLNDMSDNDQSETTTPSGAVLKRGAITYEKASLSNPSFSNYSYDLCDAFVFEKNGVRVFIADPTSCDGRLYPLIQNNNKLIRTAMGLVKIEVPDGTDPEVTEQIIKEILEKDLDIPDALEEVSEEAEKEYKIARYKWQHVVTEELTPEQVEQAEKLDRAEVFPGYTTMVEKGKYKEYLSKYGDDIRAIHELYNGGSASSIYGILTRGLMSTTERYSRGILKNGMSSYEDIDSGGADNVFTRIVNGYQRESKTGTIVVFRPEVFDRTDWYSYAYDIYGSTDDSAFLYRLSPDALFTQIANDYLPSNEQMFRTGIGADYVESIEVDKYLRDRIIADLKSMGLEKIGDRSIEEIIVVRKTLEEEQKDTNPFNDSWF